MPGAGESVSLRLQRLGQAVGFDRAAVTPGDRLVDPVMVGRVREEQLGVVVEAGSLGAPVGSGGRCRFVC